MCSGRSTVVGQAEGRIFAVSVKLRFAGFTGFLCGGALPHTPPEALPLDSAKGFIPFGNPVRLRRFYKFIAYYRLFSISSSSFIQM